MYVSNKYSAAVIPAQSQKLRVPVVLSDSKGLYLKSSVSQRVEQNILWWCESSRRTSKGVNWLKENLPRKIRLLGNIHLMAPNPAKHEKNGVCKYKCFGVCCRQILKIVRFWSYNRLFLSKSFSLKIQYGRHTK
jgi:hypothetical protein